MYQIKSTEQILFLGDYTKSIEPKLKNWIYKIKSTKQNVKNQIFAQVRESLQYCEEAFPNTYEKVSRVGRMQVSMDMNTKKRRWDCISIFLWRFIISVRENIITLMFFVSWLWSFKKHKQYLCSLQLTDIRHTYSLPHPFHIGQPFLVAEQLYIHPCLFVCL